MSDLGNWKDIGISNGKYQVSDLGYVRSINSRTRKCGHKHSPYKTKSGYLRVNLQIGGKNKYLFVHRLVAEAFCPKSEEHTEVNHINGVKHDNRAENLEWVTRAENQRHAWATGLHTKRLGQDNHACKITPRIARAIRNKKGKQRQRDTAKRYNVSQTLVAKIQRGELWSHV